MLLMIDNYDSFTYNLVQYFAELGAEVVVYRNDEITVEQIEKLNPQFIWSFRPDPARRTKPASRLPRSGTSRARSRCSAYAWDIRVSVRPSAARSSMPRR